MTMNSIDDVALTGEGALRHLNSIEFKTLDSWYSQTCSDVLSVTAFLAIPEPSILCTAPWLQPLGLLINQGQVRRARGCFCGA